MAEAKTAIANKPTWVDLATTDAAAAREFYSKVFGWKIEVNPDPQYCGYGMGEVGGKRYVHAAGTYVGRARCCHQGRIRNGWLPWLEYRRLQHRSGPRAQGGSTNRDVPDGHDEQLGVGEARSACPVAGGQSPG